MTFEKIAEFLTYGAIAVVVIFLIAFIIGVANQCPSCRKLHAKNDIGSYQTGQQITARVENFSKPITNDKGETVGQNKWTEQRQYLITSYRHDHQCKFCNNTWSTTSQEETPNFTKNL